MRLRLAPERLAMALGLVSLVLILGALGFEYLGGMPPCEMCMWQRWPHYTAIVVGLGGGLAIAGGALPRRAGPYVAGLAMVLIAVSGAIGVYHAGVEWHLWAGPAACTGPAFHFRGALNLNAPVVACDQAQWRLFGISLAGYNAIVSLGAVCAAATLLMRSATRPK